MEPTCATCDEAVATICDRCSRAICEGCSYEVAGEILCPDCHQDKTRGYDEFNDALGGTAEDIKWLLMTRFQGRHVEVMDWLCDRVCAWPSEQKPAAGAEPAEGEGEA